MRRIIITTFMLFAFAVFALAQSTVGRLLGSVSSPDGLLPGVTVTLTDNQTGRVRTVITDSSGNYKFENVSFGTYTARFSSDGFKTFVANSLIIEANREYTFNPALEVGDVAAEVTVQAGADIINSSNAELSDTINEDRIIDLPINGRNPLSLLNLQAGVNISSSSISGQRSSSVNYTRDGINVQDNFIRTGGFVQDRPTVDNTGEFTVTTQNANASLGNGGSTQVQLITPRGGDLFSGAVFLYNRNSGFAANEFGNNAAGTDALGNENAPRPFLNRNEYGGKLGGPLPVPGFGEGTPMAFMDKGFFFVTYERFQENQSSSQTNGVLLAPFRDGTFSYARVDTGAIQTVNLLSGTGFDLVPAANALNFANVGGGIGVDSTIQARLLGLTPTAGNAEALTSLSNGTPVSQRFTFNQRNNDVRNSFTMRLDFEINEDHSLYFVHRFNDTLVDRPDADAGFGFVPLASQTSTTRLFNVTYNTNLGANWTNSVTFGLIKSNPFFNESSSFPTDFLIGGLPLSLTSPEGSFQDQGRDTEQYVINDQASYSTGDHTFRFGVEANFLNLDSQTNFNRVPILTINGGNTNTPSLNSALFPGGIGGTDLGIARNLRFLLGGFIGGGAVAANFVNPSIGPAIGAPRFESFEYENYGLFFQDQWRIRPDLTLNLGVRWDYFTPLRNPDQVYLEPDVSGATTTEEVKAALLDPNGQYVIIGTSAGSPGQFYNADKNNFAPVLSVAYNPTFESGFLSSFFDGRTVFRGGFRMSTINDAFVRAADNAAGANPGLSQTVNALLGGSANLNSLLTSPPTFTLPPFAGTPISYATANANDGAFTNTIFAIDPHVETQQNMEWNIGVQREIGFDTVIEARYVGGYSDELLRGSDLNQIDINAGGFLTGFLQGRENCRVAVADRGAIMEIGACSSADIAGTAGLPGQGPITTGGSSLTGFNFLGFVRDYFVRGEVGEFAQLFITNGLDDVPFRANPNAGNVDLTTNSARYSYNAMQLEIRRRLSDGLQFQANYTFQKILADVADDSQSRFNTLLDNANPGLEYARANYDRTHTININSVYELPFGNGKRFLNGGGWTDKIFGGIRINNIINIGSGAPISIEFRDGTLNRAGRSADGTAVASLTTEQIKDLIGFHEVDGITYFIDPSVLAPNGSATGGNFEPTPNANFPDQVFFASQPGETGTLQRAFLNAPWYYRWNVGLRKDIRFGERLKLQLRADAFNVLNSTDFIVFENSTIFNIESTNFG